MKLCALITLLGMLSCPIVAMVNPAVPFPQEGLVEECDFEKDGVMWNYYNGERFKHLMFPQIDTFHKQHKDSIITRKMGNQSAAFYLAHPTDEKSKTMDRYSKAVCWRLVKYLHIRESHEDEVAYAEQQIPINLNELVFIEQNIGCIQPEKDPRVKQELKELADKPQSAHRTHLNALLGSIKAQIEEKK